MPVTHVYQTSLAWSGSTGSGYRAYDRTHRLTAPPAGPELALSADPAFGGDASLHNPEQLLLAAASSCQLLSFFAEAARAGVDVVRYDDDAEAQMPAAPERMRITRVVLRPQVLVVPGTDLARVVQLLETAHAGCFIANSLAVDVDLEPTVEHAT